MGVGKDLFWWKKILQNLEELESIEEELIPFLCTPDIFFNDKPTDVKRQFEEKLFDLNGQSYRKVPAKTLANEVVHISNSTKFFYYFFSSVGISPISKFV